jgi:aminoglycoside 6-adenylyltransferase
VIAKRDPEEVISRLVRWADGKDSIRAVLLTSTRAKPDAPVDVLSDYDVVLVVQDIRPFFQERS